MNLLRLQAEGKLAGFVPRAESQRMLKYLSDHPRPQIKVDGHGGAVALWVTNTDYSYLLGLNTKYAAVKAIDTEANGCYEPITVKVDAQRNGWTACEFNNSFNGGAEVEYPTGKGAPVTYSWLPGTSSGCPASETCYAVQFDGGPDTRGHVYAEVSSQYYCTATECPNAPVGFVWWDAGDPSATQNFIQAPSWVTRVYYMDNDSKGNIWFDYQYCPTSECEFGLGEVIHPTRKRPKFLKILPPGALEFAGGVYVSDHGKILNVTDQLTRATYQYTLPVSPSASPINTLGPTTANLFGNGDPVAGGFNQTETNLAFGDAYGWLDLGTVKKNKWTTETSINFSPSLSGAAYTPSDK